jgi:hypothetical protein
MSNVKEYNLIMTSHQADLLRDAISDKLKDDDPEMKESIEELEKILEQLA